MPVTQAVNNVGGAGSRRFQGISDFDVSRVAEVVISAKGAGLGSIRKDLGISRTTAIRWLALMVAYGLLERVYPTRGKRGRPQVVYQPTARLMDFVGKKAASSSVILDFLTLRMACKHLDGGICRFDESGKACSLSNCPLINGNKVNFS